MRNFAVSDRLRRTLLDFLRYFTQFFVFGPLVFAAKQVCKVLIIERTCLGWRSFVEKLVDLAPLTALSHKVERAIGGLFRGHLALNGW